MKIANFTKKHNKIIQDKLKKKDIHISINDLSWIIKLFISYMIKAAIRGYKISIWRIVRFAMVYRFWENGKHEENFSLSSKLFGAEFFIILDKGVLDKYQYQFVQGEYLKKELEKELSTDIVYDII